MNVYNATIRVKTVFIIHRTYFRDGTYCPDNQGYWRFEETNGGKTFSEGWVGPEEASRYPTRQEADDMMRMRNLGDYTYPALGPDLIEAVEDPNYNGGWLSVASIAKAGTVVVPPLISKDDAVRDPNATAEDYLPKQGPVQEFHIYLPAFAAILTALIVENEQLGFTPQGYYMNHGIVMHYKHFRTFQPDGSNVVQAFHFESDFQTIYMRNPDEEA